MDLQHTYIDGTKIEANANRYTWIWKNPMHITSRPAEKKETVIRKQTMMHIRNIRLLMPDTVLTIIIFIAKNTAWKNTSDHGKTEFASRSC